MCPMGSVGFFGAFLGWALTAGGVRAPQLPGGQHEDVFFLLVEAQLLAGQPGFLQLPLGSRKLPGKGPGVALLPVHPVRGHLVADVVVQGAVRVVGQHLLGGEKVIKRGKLQKKK